jgi:hypothetical protein
VPPASGGAAIVWEFFLPEGSFAVTNYYLGVATMEEAFGAAGLREVRWHAPEVWPEGVRVRPGVLGGVPRPPAGGVRRVPQGGPRQGMRGGRPGVLAKSRLLHRLKEQFSELIE